MNFKTLFTSFRDAVFHSPVLLSVCVLVLGIALFLMLDAHKVKKKRNVAKGEIDHRP